MTVHAVSPRTLTRAWSDPMARAATGALVRRLFSRDVRSDAAFAQRPVPTTASLQLAASTAPGVQLGASPAVAQASAAQFLHPDLPSIRRLSSERLRDMAYGFQDPYAALLQEQLGIVLGRDITVDGLPGAGTETAIVEFNERYGIPGNTSVFGPGAWQKLMELRGGPGGLRPEWHHDFDEATVRTQLVAAVEATGEEISAGAIETLTRAYANFLESEDGVLVRSPLVYLADYGQRYATTERGWVFDLSRGELVEGPFHIAHGRGSDANDGGAHRIAGSFDAPYGSEASPFSDRPESNENNLGLFTTRPGHYHSANFNAAGLRLDGRSEGYNDRSLDRAVLVHGAWYVDPSKGHYGRSLSCQAMSVARANRLLPTLTSAVVFNYAPVPSWLEGDPLLQD